MVDLVIGYYANSSKMGYRIEYFDRMENWEILRF